MVISCASYSVFVISLSLYQDVARVEPVGLHATSRPEKLSTNAFICKVYKHLVFLDTSELSWFVRLVYHLQLRKKKCSEF